MNTLPCKWLLWAMSMCLQKPTGTIPSRKTRSAFASLQGVKAAARFNVWVVFHSWAFHWGWNWLSQTIPWWNLLYLWSGDFLPCGGCFFLGYLEGWSCSHGFRSGFSALGQPCQFSQDGKIGWKLMPSPPAHWQSLSLFISLLFEDIWEMLGLLSGQVQHQLWYLLLKIFLLLLITDFDICI